MLIALPPRLFADLVGKPFVEGARGPDAYDCVGLTVELLRRSGFAVPSYASTEEEFAAQHRDGLLGPCSKIDRAMPGCVVLMRDFPDGRHLGVMVDRFRMLHAARYSGQVCLEQLSRSPFGRRILGFYFPEVRAAVSETAFASDKPLCRQPAYDNGGDA